MQTKHISEAEIGRALAPYRGRIDATDDRIIDLLVERYAIIAEVATLKSLTGIPSVLPDRVNEVIERVVGRARIKGLDPAFVRALYKTMITHAHAIEDEAKRQRLAKALKK
jgi:isochorismate pyruvate lyase